MKSKQRLYRAMVGVHLVVFLLAAFPVYAQENTETRLSITPREDGFEGVFRRGDAIYHLENYVKEKSFKTSIYRPNGDVLIEARREGALTFISLPTIELKLDRDNPAPFSSVEITAIQAFTKSEDAVVVRQIVYEVLAKRKAEMRPLVTGFSVIAMLLGEG